MLVVSRKLNESLRIDGQIDVTIVSIQGGCVRLGITAPPGVSIRRYEIDVSLLPPERAPLKRFAT